MNAILQKYGAVFVFLALGYFFRYVSSSMIFKVTFGVGRAHAFLPHSSWPILLALQRIGVCMVVLFRHLPTRLLYFLTPHFLYSLSPFPVDNFSLQPLILLLLVLYYVAEIVSTVSTVGAMLQGPTGVISAKKQVRFPPIWTSSRDLFWPFTAWLLAILWFALVFRRPFTCLLY